MVKNLNKFEIEVEGLNCASCAAKIEEKIKKLPGVKDANVSFATQKIVVETQDKDILASIRDSSIEIAKDTEKGLKVKLIKEPDYKLGQGNTENRISENNKNENRDNNKYKIIVEATRFVSSLIILLIAIFIKMPFGASLALFIISYIIIGFDVLFAAARNIIKGRLFDENFLMSIATIGAFSILQFPEAVSVMLFYKLGEFIQGAAVKRSRKSISKLIGIRADYANIKINEVLTKVSPEDVSIGDTIWVKPGERIPLDGIIISGQALIDTSALTGESMPRDSQTGDVVLSGTINLNGLLEIKVEKEFGESTVSKILEIVENANSKKAPIEKFITKFSRVYTPLVVVTAALIALIPPLLIPGAMFSDWIYRALVFLVVSCPCALVISIPLGFFGGIGGASKNGILVKGGNYLEALDDVDTVVFDKTGTLTKGIFEVTKIVYYENSDLKDFEKNKLEKHEFHFKEIDLFHANKKSMNNNNKNNNNNITNNDEDANSDCKDCINKNITMNANINYNNDGDVIKNNNSENFAINSRVIELVQYAAVAEINSNHPIAMSIIKAYENKILPQTGITPTQLAVNFCAENYEEIMGFGLKITCNSKKVFVGNTKLMERESITLPPDVYNEKGTLIHVAENAVYLGYILISDEIKSDSKQTISELRNLGIKRIVMLTGDRKNVGETIAKEIGITEVYTDLLPVDKVMKLEEIEKDKKTKGSLLFIGDGINDAPVLARSDVGFAMGGVGSDAAIEAADVIIMTDEPMKVVHAIHIAKKTKRIVWQNIIFALSIKGVVLLLGAFGIATMWEAVFADVGVALLAVLNSARAMKHED